MTDQQRQLLDSPLTINEFKEAVTQMALNSSPGYDGITAAFYKKFFPLIGPYMFKAFNYSINVKKELFQSARRGILTLLPKKQKCPMKVTNWRPITLMTVDHHIYAKVLANRV